MPYLEMEEVRIGKCGYTRTISYSREVILYTCKDRGKKNQICKEQYCIGTWNVRSINQGKLEVVKKRGQE